MGPAQKLILLIGLIIIGLMWVYPPWIYTYEGHTFSFSHEAGYFLFFKRPMPYGMRLDMPLLLTQCASVATLASGIALLLRRVQRSRSHER
jgi:hypothetical protein